MSENDRYLGKLLHENNYRICKKIGYGGFGVVYLADHQHLEGKQMVIKFLDNQNPWLLNEDVVEAFEKMRKAGNILQKLQHRNILHIEDVGIFEQRIPYLILDYAANGTMRQKMRSNEKPLPLEEILGIIKQAADALQYMHEHQMIHRDVKPENMLFDDKRTLLLSDMGSAAVLTTMQTTPRSIEGTPQYMAPEQFEGLIDFRSDQYALGCVAYELLTGRLPVTLAREEHSGEPLLSTYDSAQASQEQRLWSAELLLWAKQHAQIVPQRPSVYARDLPLYIELAILKALAKQPKDRHPDMATFVGALQSESYDSSKYQHLKEEWVQEGDRLCREQSYPEALEVYQWVKQFAEHDPGVDRRIARVYMAQGKDEQALDICSQILQFAPGDVQTYLLQADLFSRRNDFGKALATCEEVLKQVPHDVSALRLRADSLYQLRRYQEAVETCQQLLERVSHDGSALELAARVSALGLKAASLHQLQRYREVVETCQQLLERVSHDGSALELAAKVSALGFKAVSLYQLQRYQEAVETCNRLLRCSPGDLVALQYKKAALRRYGDTLFEQRRYQEADEVYAQAGYLDESDIAIWLLKGELFFQQGKYPTALEAYRRARQLSQDRNIAALEGMKQTLLKQAEAARGWGQKAEAARLEAEANRITKRMQSLFDE